MAKGCVLQLALTTLSSTWAACVAAKAAEALMVNNSTWSSKLGWGTHTVQVRQGAHKS